MKSKIIIALLAITVLLVGLFAYSKADDTEPVVSDTIETTDQQEVEEENTVDEVVEEEPEQEVEEVDTVEPEQVAQEIEPDPEPVEEAAEDKDTSDLDQSDIEALDLMLFSQGNVNLRQGPSTDYEKSGSLSTNQQVHVTGQSKSTSWYQVEINGETHYVSNKYLASTKITVSEPSTDNSSSNNGGGGSGSGSSNNGGGGSSSNNGGGTINGKSIQDYLESTGGTTGTPSLPSRDYVPGEGNPDLHLR